MKSDVETHAAGSTAVLVVEDHPLMRETLEEAITRMDGFEVCGTSDSGEDALGRLEEMGPDLVILDMALPGLTGSEVVTAIRLILPHLPCVILSGHREAHYVDRAVAAGAQGYILKGDPYEIAEGIRRVAEGEVYFSPALRRH